MSQSGDHVVVLQYADYIASHKTPSDFYLVDQSKNMARDFFVVDAFATDRFTGNPAAVLVDGEGLSDDQMRSIAAEFNLSETTFVLAPLDGESTNSGDDSNSAYVAVPKHRLRFRWFTPKIEVGMCGHATLAGVHALIESQRLPNESDDSFELAIDTRSGRITAFVERWPGENGGRIYWLELRPPELSPARVDRHELAHHLSLTPDDIESELPLARTQDDDVLVFVRDVMLLNGAKPNFAGLADFCTQFEIRGVSLATVNTLTPSINLQSRFFAPVAGVNEDPVTGSVHSPLCAYLVKHQLVPIHDDTAGMVCIQGIPGGRTGLLYGLVRVAEDGTMNVRVGGKAVTSMRGQLLLE